MVLVRLPTLWEPRWYSDEGTFTTVAWVHSLGRPLYSGVFDINPPGIYWLYGALLRLGGEQHHVVIQAALLIAVLVSVLCVYGIGSTWFGSRVGVAAAGLAAVGLSLPTLDGDLLNIEIAALPFFLTALLLATRSSAGTAFAVGIFGACALLIRPSYALDSIAILALIWMSPGRGRRMLLAVAGGALVLAAAAAALAIGDALPAYLGEAMPLQRAYVVWANGGSLFPLAIRLAIALGVAALWFWPVRRKPWAPLAIWLPASIAAASITPRELSHYSVEVLPPAALAIALALSSGLVRLSPHHRRQRRLALIGAFPLALVAMVMTAEAALIIPPREVALLDGTSAPPPFLHNFSYPDLPAYYARWATWAVQHPLRSQPLDGFPGPFGDEQAEAVMLDRVARGATPHLQVLGDRAWVYFLSRLPPASPYVAMNSAFRLDPSATRIVAESLSHHRAGLVSMADVPDGDWLPLLQAANYQQVASAPWPTYASSTRR